MPQRIVGLDIGTSAIRAVELTVGEGAKPILEAFGQVGLPPGAVVDGEIRDRQGLIGALQRLWHDGGFAEKKVIVGVAGLRAITRELDMPVLPADELDDAVRFQADEVVPFPLERTSLSARVIAEYADKDGTPTQRVLLAAAHRDLIDSVVAVTQGAGLEPVGIDLNTAAVVRALYDPQNDVGPEAIVSVGAGLTLVVVHQGGVLQFVRTVDLGGESITKAIASSMDIPVVDAETLKRHLGEPGSDPRAKSAARQAMTDLVAEIHNSIRFYSSLPGRNPVKRVLVTGAGARVLDFVATLAHGLDVPVELASPLSMVDTTRLPITDEQAEAINPTLTVPVGLALPEPGGRPFNLMPKEVIEKAQERKVRRALIAAGVGVVVLLVALSVWRVLAVNNAKNQIGTLQASITTIQDVQIPKYDQAVRLKTEVAGQEALGVPAVSSEIDWLVVFNQLAQYLPPSAVYGNLDLTATPPAASSGGTGSSVTTAAVSNSPSDLVGSISTTVTVPDLPYVTTWGQAMMQAPALANVVPTGSLSNSPTGVTFTASMQINALAHTHRLDEFTQVLP